MLMLLGISPEMTTAAYRVGDGATNIITPLMVYFPLILVFCGIGVFSLNNSDFDIFLPSDNSHSE